MAGPLRKRESFNPEKLEAALRAAEKDFFHRKEIVLEPGNYIFESIGHIPEFQKRIRLALEKGQSRTALILVAAVHKSQYNPMDIINFRVGKKLLELGVTKEELVKHGIWKARDYDINKK